MAPAAACCRGKCRSSAGLLRSGCTTAWRRSSGCMRRQRLHSAMHRDCCECTIDTLFLRKCAGKQMERRDLRGLEPLIHLQCFVSRNWCSQMLQVPRVIFHVSKVRQYCTAKSKNTQAAPHECSTAPPDTSIGIVMFDLHHKPQPMSQRSSALAPDAPRQLDVL